MSFEISNGDVILVSGPNGVGKSALLAEMFRTFGPNQASYLPGHRQIHINSTWDTFGQQLEQFDSMLFQQHTHFSRYKNSWAEDHFKKLLKILYNMETVYLRRFRDRVAKNEESSADRERRLVSPIDQINLIFKAAQLPIQIKINDFGMGAIRSEQEYSIEALSDGERAALFLAAATVCQPPNTVLLIDEPEKHLNPAISFLLIEACTRLRLDIAFVFSTHDINLIENLTVSKSMHIKNSAIIQIAPERRNYDIEMISFADENFEEVKRSLVGARSNVLFVEGDFRSTDLSLYGFLYPDWKIVPKGAFQKVCESVKALADFRGGHWIYPSGLIDGDGHSVEEVEKLASLGIFALPFPSVENCFMCESAISAYIKSDIEFRGGSSVEARFKSIENLVPKLVSSEKDKIIALRTSWLLERRLSEKKLSTKAILNGVRDDIVVSVSSVFAEVEDQVLEVIRRGDWRDMLFRLPLKRTAVPSEVAKLAGASNYENYVKVILRSVETESAHGANFVSQLRSLLPSLVA